MALTEIELRACRSSHASIPLTMAFLSPLPTALTSSYWFGSKRMSSITYCRCTTWQPTSVPSFRLAVGLSAASARRDTAVARSLGADCHLLDVMLSHTGHSATPEMCRCRVNWTPPHPRMVAGRYLQKDSAGQRTTEVAQVVRRLHCCRTVQVRSRLEINDDVPQFAGLATHPRVGRSIDRTRDRTRPSSVPVRC